MKRVFLWVILLSLVGSEGIWSAHAATFNSTNFSINGNLGDSVAGSQSSANYGLISAAGESIAGQSSSSSYRLGQGYVPTLEKSLELTVQPNNLNAYFAFEDDTGLGLTDTSTQSSDGKFTGLPKRNAGISGQAIQLTGSEYGTVPHSSANNLATLTVSAWIKTTTTPSADQSIIEKRNGSSGAFPYAMRLTASGTVYCSSGDGVSTVISSTGIAVNDGAWHHIVCTKQASGVNGIYLDGSQRSNPVASLGSVTNLSDVGIGARTNGTQTYAGTIDEVKLFNQILSPNQIKAEYEAGIQATSAGLSLETLTPGVSQTRAFDAIVNTDAPGYTLAVNQNTNLTRVGGGTISSVAGTIASPVIWSEGVTKGLGFTLYGTNATAIPGTWASGSGYAALPAAPTSFYTRSNYTGGTKDILNMRLRLDTASSQITGDYSNQIVITGTMTP